MASRRFYCCCKARVNPDGHRPALGSALLSVKVAMRGRFGTTLPAERPPSVSESGQVANRMARACHGFEQHKNRYPVLKADTCASANAYGSLRCLLEEQNLRPVESHHRAADTRTTVPPHRLGSPEACFLPRRICWIRLDSRQKWPKSTDPQQVSSINFEVTLLLPLIFDCQASQLS